MLSLDSAIWNSSGGRAGVPFLRHAALAALAGQETRGELSSLVARHLDAEEPDGVTAYWLARSLLALFGSVREQRDSVNAIIAGNRFRLLYQPIVRFSDRSVHRHEALLRLDPSDTAFASTQEFVRLIEALHLSEALDLAVVGRVLEVLRAHPHELIMVNVAGPSLQSAAFREAIVELVAHRPQLVVEVTETTAITDLDAAAETLGQLRARGVGVCLDDFGTGYASLHYLRDLPVDCVKIDGSYTNAAVSSPRDRDFVVAINELSRSAGIKTIAEKIETEEQAALMTELGVVFGQGWLFGRPSAAIFEEKDQLSC